LITGAKRLLQHYLPEAVMTYSEQSFQCSPNCHLANAGTQDRIVRPPAVLATSK
jgi:hypothetical protein